MKIRVKALTSFAHGNTVLHEGQEGEYTRGDAQELVKSGLAQMLDGGADQSEPEDDILGETETLPRTTSRAKK